MSQVELVKPGSFRDSDIEKQFLSAFVLTSHVHVPPSGYLPIIYRNTILLAKARAVNPSELAMPP
jgi:hypothetical protein